MRVGHHVKLHGMIREMTDSHPLFVACRKPVVTEESCFGWGPDFKGFNSDLEKLECT